MRKFWTTTYLLFFSVLLIGNTAWTQEDEVPENIVTIQDQRIQFSDDGQLMFSVVVKEGFFSYLEKFTLTVDGRAAEDLKFDPVVTFFDKTFNKNKHGVKSRASAKGEYKTSKTYAAGDKVAVRLGYQACTTEYCLFPTGGCLRADSKQGRS